MLHIQHFPNRPLPSGRTCSSLKCDVCGGQILDAGMAMAIVPCPDSGDGSSALDSCLHVHKGHCLGYVERFLDTAAPTMELITHLEELAELCLKHAKMSASCRPAATPRRARSSRRTGGPRT